MNYRSSILLALGSPIVLSSATALEPERSKADEKRYNILCLVAEDISPYLGCYGDMYANTPNLDKLAMESIRYTRMFTTIGVSAPSRASLITGLFPTSFGANYMRTSNTKPLTEGLVPPYEAVPERGVKCYTEYLRAAGYFCTNNAKMDYQFTVPLTAWDENGKTAHWKHRPDGVPFFAIFNMEVSHESQVWKRANEPLVIHPDSIIPPPYHPDDETTRRDWAVAYSNIHEMDKQVQQFIDEVDEAGLLDETIIIWYSDNGGPMPRQKRELYESGTLVPFMVRFPDGKLAGMVDNDLHMFVDIPATILSLANILPPDYMHGIPFLGKFKGESRNYVYGARDRLDEIVERQTCVRDGRFRYVRNYLPEKSGYMEILSRLNMPMMQNMVRLFKRGKLNKETSRWFEKPRKIEELYDVNNDPHEMKNLIDNPAYSKEVERLRGEMEAWNKCYNPYLGLTEAELREKLWPGGEQPIVEPPVCVKTGTNKIQVKSNTPGSSIAYQINGRGYTEEHWFLYTRPIQLNEGDRLNMRAFRIGYKPSRLITYQNE